MSNLTPSSKELDNLLDVNLTEAFKIFDRVPEEGSIVDYWDTERILNLINEVKIEVEVLTV